MSASPRNTRNNFFTNSDALRISHPFSRIDFARRLDARLERYSNNPKKFLNGTEVINQVLGNCQSDCAMMRVSLVLSCLAKLVSGSKLELRRPGVAQCRECQ